VTVDGRDGNGLQLEKIGPIYFEVVSWCPAKIAKN